VAVAADSAELSHWAQRARRAARWRVRAGEERGRVLIMMCAHRVVECDTCALLLHSAASLPTLPVALPHALASSASESSKPRRVVSAQRQSAAGAISSASVMTITAATTTQGGRKDSNSK
jgi:hypothetical protein